MVVVEFLSSSGSSSSSDDTSTSSSSSEDSSVAGDNAATAAAAPQTIMIASAMDDDACASAEHDSVSHENVAANRLSSSRVGTSSSPSTHRATSTEQDQGVDKFAYDASSSPSIHRATSTDQGVDEFAFDDAALLALSDGHMQQENVTGDEYVVSPFASAARAQDEEPLPRSSPYEHENAQAHSYVRRFNPPSPDSNSSLETPHALTPKKDTESRFFRKDFSLLEEQDDQATQKKPSEDDESRFFRKNISQEQDDRATQKKSSEVADASASTSSSPKGPSSNGNGNKSLRPMEANPSVLRPPPYRHKPDPLVHYLSIHNRPVNLRKRIPVKDLFPSPIHNMWKSKYSNFNHLQSEVASSLADSNDSVVVSAPTGAGKTALFEMAMARFFLLDLQRAPQSHPTAGSHQSKAVYVAPSKALCEERFEDWSRRLSDMNIGIECAMITGDAEPGDTFRDIAAAHVILTTPEKWDSITRRWTEHFFLLGSVKLLMIDEVHLLGDQSRGWTLESIVCRMKTIDRATRESSHLYDPNSASSYNKTTPEALAAFLRIVAVSATLPNVSSIASFLEANEAYVFDASYRPVPLTTHVMGLGYVGKNPFMFGKSLNRHVPELVRRFSEGKPTLIFCHTKKETECLAMELANSSGRKRNDNVDIAGKTKISALQKCLLQGIAYHNAGLDAPDRKLIEQAFIDGRISCLCATSTLACGVNLPARLVIIKGTVAWRGHHEEIDTGSLLQMMGRAGRPGFDTSGTAIIMTDNMSKHKFEKLSDGLEVVESHLYSRLVEVFNSEISQSVVTSLKDAVNWIKTSFYFSRVRENPHHYGLHQSSSESVEEHFLQVCQNSLQQLHDENIISFDKDSGQVFATAACHIMSQHLVEFNAMRTIIALPFDAGQSRLLTLLSDLEGLQRPVRRPEKKLLNNVHKLIKYKLDGPPSKVRVQTPPQKAWVLLQAAIGQQFLEDFTLRQEMSSMVEYATRMLSAVEDYSTEGSKHGQVALQSLRLRRSLATSLWSANDGVLNQLGGVGQKTTAKLKFNNILSFADILATPSDAIDKAASRAPPFGTELRSVVGKLLQNTLRLSASVNDSRDVPHEIICTLTPPENFSDADGRDSTEKSGLVKYTLAAFTDRPGGCLFFRSNIPEAGQYRFDCPDKFGKVYIHLVASMVGLDEHLILDGKDEVLKSSYTASPPRVRNMTKNQREQSKSRSSDARCPRAEDGRTKRTTLKSTGAARQPPLRVLQDSRNNAGSNEAGKSTAITPSPRAPTVPGRQPINPKQFSGSKNRMFPSSAAQSEAKKPRPSKSSWTVERLAQSTSQESAFRYKKENPFQRFQHDPNNAESSLDDLAGRVGRNPTSGSDASVIPPHASSMLRKTATARVATRPGLGRASFELARSKDKGRKRRKFPSSSLPEPDLLQMKAMEQQAYEDSMSQLRNGARGSESQYEDSSLFPHGHPMREQHGTSMTEFEHPSFASQCQTTYEHRGFPSLSLHTPLTSAHHSLDWSPASLRAHQTALHWAPYESSHTSHYFPTEYDASQIPQSHSLLFSRSHNPIGNMVYNEALEAQPEVPYYQQNLVGESGVFFRPIQDAIPETAYDCVHKDSQRTQENGLGQREIRTRHTVQSEPTSVDDALLDAAFF